MSELVKLELVNLREFWKLEESDFSPWIASDDGLAWVGDELGLNLVDGRTEVPAGPYRADVVCRDESVRGRPVNVVIENFMDPLDHEHLGKLLTYAAELNAEILVWIAPKIGTQLRKTVEWLNARMANQIRSFAVEATLSKVNEGVYAPSFNVVSQPEDWAGTPARQMTGLEIQHLKYWREFQSKFDQYETGLKCRTPVPLFQMGFSVGKAGINLHAARLKSTRSLRIELELRGRNRAGYFAALYDKQEEIRKEIEGALEWIENDPRSLVQLTGDLDPTNESDWPNQIKWMCENLGMFNRAFRDRIHSIDPAEWQ